MRRTHLINSIARINVPSLSFNSTYTPRSPLRLFIADRDNYRMVRITTKVRVEIVQGSACGFGVEEVHDLDKSQIKRCKYLLNC